MTGNVPQPGEKPRNEGEPWAYTDANIAWWRVEEERDEVEAMADAVAARPRHPRRRPNAAGPDEATPAFAPEAVDAHAAGVQDASTELQPAADADGPDGVPDVMVLPEPNPNRPTVTLDRTPAPDQTHPGRLSEAARERLENSSFWTPEEEPAATPEDPPPAARTRRSRRKAPKPRRPLPGLIALVALALIAAFFSWVSAEPFWLAAGHGDRGVATISQCTGSGVTQRCTGVFAADDGRYTVQRVTVLGVDQTARATGRAVPARMVSPDSRQAYVGEPGWMLHLRWVLGFILVLMCGYGIAGMTGARQLETAPARRGAVLISVAGPVVLLLAFLAATF